MQVNVNEYERKDRSGILRHVKSYSRRLIPKNSTNKRTILRRKNELIPTAAIQQKLPQIQQKIEQEIVNQFLERHFAGEIKSNPEYYGVDGKHPAVGFDEDVYQEWYRSWKSGKLAAKARAYFLESDDLPEVLIRQILKHPPDADKMDYEKQEKTIKKFNLNQIDWEKVASSIERAMQFQETKNYEKLAKRKGIQVVEWENTQSYKDQQKRNQDSIIEYFKKAKQAGVTNINEFGKRKILNSPIDSFKRNIRLNFSEKEINDLLNHFGVTGF